MAAEKREFPWKMICKKRKFIYSAATCLAVILCTGWTGLQGMAADGFLEKQGIRETQEIQEIRETQGAQEVQEIQEIQEDELWNLAEDYLNLGELEDSLKASVEDDVFSFRETLKELLLGEVDFDFQEILSGILRIFLVELNALRENMVQILIVVFAGAVFSNFVKVFENSQIADISYYMIYMLASALLVKSFAVMNEVTEQACESILEFMKVLLPSYLVTVVLSSGTVTALGFYEITILALQVFQLLIVRFILPAIHFYLILLILNQMASEDYFSKFAQLMETMVGWTIKSMLGAVVGLQAVQCLTAPAVDSLKNSAAQRLAKSIPGIGGALDAASETVAGSAVILKNAVGVTGMIALAVICLTPIVKLVAAILMFRLLSALIQPVCEKRLVEGIESVAAGMTLLLRVLIAGVSVFVISLAMITASVRS